MSEPSRPQIPDRRAFKAADVCALAQVQPYVLRSWESEFPDLGQSKTPGGPRIYRRVDVDRVLRIKELVFGEGLTLSGARRRLEEEAGGRAPAPPENGELDPGDDGLLRERVRAVRQGLLELASMLERNPAGPAKTFSLESPEAPAATTVGRRRPTSRARRGAARDPE